jgi:RimJ/RimL family protein N-acetyltransferase
MLELKELTYDLISPEYVSSMNNPELLKFTGARVKEWDIDSIKKYISDNRISDDSVLLGIFLDSTHCGNIRLHSIDTFNNTCEIGILIFSPSVWNKGIATESIGKALDFANRNLGVTRIMADYFEENLASSRVFSKCGFVYEGIFLKHFKNLNGSYSNSVRVAYNFSERIDHVRKG